MQVFQSQQENLVSSVLKWSFVNIFRKINIFIIFTGFISENFRTFFFVKSESYFFFTDFFSDLLSLSEKK